MRIYQELEAIHIRLVLLQFRDNFESFTRARHPDIHALAIDMDSALGKLTQHGVIPKQIDLIDENNPGLLRIKAREWRLATQAVLGLDAPLSERDRKRLNRALLNPSFIHKIRVLANILLSKAEACGVISPQGDRRAFLADFNKAVNRGSRNGFIGMVNGTMLQRLFVK